MGTWWVNNHVKECKTLKSSQEGYCLFDGLKVQATLNATKCEIQ